MKFKIDENLPVEFAQDKNHLINCLRRIIPLLEKEPILNKLWMVEEDRLRIRE